MNGCFHCGEPLPSDGATCAVLDGSARAFCCAGCCAAAELIRGLGLDRYYEVRDAHSPRVDAGAFDAAAWDLDSALGAALTVRGDRRELVLALEGVRCAACAWLVERVLGRHPAVLSVELNPATARMRLAWRTDAARLSELLALLPPLGYRPCLPGTDDAGAERERRTAMKRLAVAGLGAMQAMMFAEALYFGDGGSMDLATRDFFRWVGLAVSTPVVFYSGLPFLRGALAELRARRVAMDVLVSLTVLLAWGASVFETLRGGPVVYFDAAVMFVFLLLATRELERGARRRAASARAVLARAQPARARRRTASGIEDVPASHLRAGDVVCVAVGDAVPADGTLLTPQALLSEAVLTGEPEAVPRRRGDRVLAGSVCVAQPLELGVTACGDATTIAQVARLAEQAAARRPRAAALADRIASRFVVVLLLAALAIGAAWAVVDASRVLPVVLAVLAVTCPCALALAVPATIASAHSRLARQGVLALDPDALEALARVDHVAFDKTGTLTEGSPRLAAFEAAGDARRALAIAAALEREVAHPLAAAIRAAAQGPVELHATDVHVVAGAGVAGTVDGVPYRIGSPAFAGAPGSDARIVLAGPDGVIARFALEDRVRDEAPAVVAALARHGLALRLWSGDAAGAVGSVARACGIGAHAARMSPADKLAAMRELQHAGHRVAMVGDGINDAPVLAGADVSFALGDGSALAHANADFVVLGARLGAVTEAFEVARGARRIVRQNLAWALGYNLLALPVAALGWAPPWLAAVGMALSSLAVTANALRLVRRPRGRVARRAGVPVLQEARA